MGGCLDLLTLTVSLSHIWDWGMGGWVDGWYGQVTFVEAVDGLMPGFDPEIGKMAQRILINPRKIDYYTGVLAKKVHSPRT